MLVSVTGGDASEGLEVMVEGRVSVGERECYVFDGHRLTDAAEAYTTDRVCNHYEVASVLMPQRRPYH